MHRNMLVAVIPLAVSMTCADASAFAQGRGRGHAKARPAEHARPAGKGKPVVAAVVVDRDGHVRAIREYARAGSLPPGLAKREALPPGLRKQLREGGELPPGLQKRLVPVPAPLLARLPALPAYYQRHFIGDDLIVIDTRSHRVIAIVPNVWR